VQVRFCDELGFAFGWIVDEFLQRCSHALVVDGRVWVVDPVDGDGVEERVRAAGDPAGVIQLLDRHNRDCRELATRLGVSHHVVPRASIEQAPFEFAVVRDARWWKEVALWWPGERTLVVGDALGTVPELRVADERLALHPLLRLTPPRRAFGGFDPRHVLCGHGEGVQGDEATPALREALATARRRLPRAWLQGARATVRTRRAERQGRLRNSP
jgi:hypothetical protein